MTKKAGGDAGGHERANVKSGRHRGGIPTNPHAGITAAAGIRRGTKRDVAACVVAPTRFRGFIDGRDYDWTEGIQER
jgi:hypothetical protein